MSANTSHIYYTQASSGWTVSIVSVATNSANLNDRNFNTPYTVTGASSATKVVYIDRGVSPTSGSLLRNPIQTLAITMYSGSKTNFGANARICIGQHDVLKAAKQVGQVSGSLSTYLNQDNGLFVLDIPTLYNKRFVKISFENFTANPTLTQVMLLRKNTIPRAASMYDSSENFTHYEIDTTVNQAYDLSTSVTRTDSFVFKKSYPIYGPAQIKTGQLIFKDCQGMVQPFIYQPGTTIGEMRLCKMTKKDSDIVEKQFNNKVQVFTFKEIYRIPSGYNS